MLRPNDAMSAGVCRVWLASLTRALGLAPGPTWPGPPALRLSRLGVGSS